MANRQDSIATLQDPEESEIYDDSGYSSVPDVDIPSLSYSTLSSSSTSVESSISLLRSRFLCPHSIAARARKRYFQLRDHPDRVHPTDKHVLPPEPQQLPLQEQIRRYIVEHHMSSVQNAMKESVASKAQLSAMISRYVIRLGVDPVELLHYNPGLGNQLLSDLDSVLPDIHLVCCQIMQQRLGEEKALLAEQLRLSIRISHIPSVFQECHLSSLALAFESTREDTVRNSNNYNGFVTVSGRVSGVSLTEHVIYSQTFKCGNPKCNNRNYLHYTPSASHNRVIKRAEDDGFMETGTNATLLMIDLLCSHCDEEMPESVLDRVYINCTSASQGEGCFINQITVTLEDDLANTVALGEHVRLLGKISRVFAEEDRLRYNHGIRFEVNNILREPDCRQARVPDAIAALIYRNTSAWNTSQSIIDLLDGIAPKHVVYRRLKLALLLSAVSIPEHDDNEEHKVTRKTDIRSSVHVLVVKNSFDTIVPALIASLATSRRNVYWDYGDDTLRRPLYHVCKPSSTFSGSLQGITKHRGHPCCKQLIIEKFLTTRTLAMIPASLLGRAKDGILLFELDQLDKKSLSHVAPILNAVDGSEIYIQREDSIQAQDLICCCWSTYMTFSPNMPRNYGKETKAEDALTGPACGITMIEAFDIVVLQNEPVEVSDVSQAVATHTMERFSSDIPSSVSQCLSTEQLSQEYGLDTEASMMDAKVPFSVEDERDCTMKRMHAHLMRVIAENFV
ncbi:MAG: hypothetical protein J3Q66DRAFT_438993 [Benniella sp.]|nr:MAG: hypothetical protein J3Q66DRAFT_438993 [Benniella sp.]